MRAAIGYPGFSYLRSPVGLNPMELLMDDLESLVTEALAWLPVTYPHLNWDWLTTNAKLRDRQNRLGFVVELAWQAAEKRRKLPSGRRIGCTSCRVGILSSGEGRYTM
jgi:hypothetical protein